MLRISILTAARGVFQFMLLQPSAADNPVVLVGRCVLVVRLVAVGSPAGGRRLLTASNEPSSGNDYSSRHGFGRERFGHRLGIAHVSAGICFSSDRDHCCSIFQPLRCSWFYRLAGQEELITNTWVVVLKRGAAQDVAAATAR